MIATVRVECGIAPQPFPKNQYSNTFYSLTKLNNNKKCACSHYSVTHRYTNSLNQVPSISVVRPVHSDMMNQEEKFGAYQ
jgi:alpha-ketoglutarate-dependent taurine dioxygenase